jgi:hypothetical protein
MTRSSISVIKMRTTCQRNIQPESSVALPSLQLGIEHGNMHVIREYIMDALVGDV